MIAKAIGPQNTVGAIGIMPSTVETAVSMIGRKRVALASSAASRDALAGRALRLDLADQDDRVLGDDADQREDAEQRHEAERLARQQQRADDADQAERRDAEHDDEPREALQLHHQHGEHDEQHQRHDGDDRGLRLRALLDRAAGRDVVAGRQRLAQLLDRRARAPTTTVSGSAPGVTSASTVRVGTRSRRQTSGYSCS